MEKPRTLQEQKVADMFRLMGFDVKMHYIPRGLNQQMEIDVLAVKEKLRIAVECKDYTDSNISRNDIDYFSQKLRTLGGTLGIFVANSYSLSLREYCEEKGLLPLQTEDIESTIENLSRRIPVKYLPISRNVWELLGSFKTLIAVWEDFVMEWPIATPIPDVEKFQNEGLMNVHYDEYQNFSYTLTDLGKEFFGQLAVIQKMIADEEIYGVENELEAKNKIVEILNSTNNTSVGVSTAFDKIVLYSIGLVKILTMELSQFAQCLLRIIRN